AFPREGVAREEHLVAPGAHAVDGARARIRPVLLLPARWKRPNEGASKLERRQEPHIRDVLATAAVARLAPDADLDEVRGVEAFARGAKDGFERADAALRRFLRSEKAKLVASRLRERVESHDRQRPPAIRWKNPIDDFALVAERRRSDEL